MHPVGVARPANCRVSVSVRTASDAAEGVQPKPDAKASNQCKETGIIIFLPFLIIDLVVAAILMSMGMMMVPPAMVALPIKLAFFVVADGWTLISSALVRSYF